MGCCQKFDDIIKDSNSTIIRLQDNNYVMVKYIDRNSKKEIEWEKINFCPYCGNKLYTQSIMDICPICKKKRVWQCKCPISDSGCENGHTWHYCLLHKCVVIGKYNHEKGINNCTCNN